MKSLHIIQPGMMTTVQDLGRIGCASSGVAQGGAADSLSLRAGNRLVGNPDTAAALEITLVGGEYEFTHPCSIALTGGLADASVSSTHGTRSARAAFPLPVLPGERVRIGAVRRGTRCYLCISGGIDVPVVMSSRSTHVSANFGGFQGRALQPGDTLALHDAAYARGRESPEIADLLSRTIFRSTLRATAMSTSALDEATNAWFWNSTFTVSSSSNRMGVRLEGVPRPPGTTGRMVSEGMMQGAVQIPENGLPIVLGCEHPTTGGYPLIACVIAADLPALGQCRPGQPLRFERVDHAHARTLHRDLHAALDLQLPP